MRTFFLASLGLLLSLSPAGTAQGTTFPPGFESTSAGYYANYLGRYPVMKFQAVYGDLQGSNSAFTFGELALRRESSGLANFARTWANVQLAVGDCDYTHLSDTFGDNLPGKTMVFSGSVTWPATSGKPANDPAPWGEFLAKDDVRFPFGTGGTNASFLHTGKSGFGVEFAMSGGVLANAATWSATAGRDYFVDGIETNHQYTGGRYVLTQAANGCTQAYFATWLFSDRLVGGGSQFRAQLFANLGQPSSFHFGGISVNTILTAPIPFLGSCNGMSIDLSKRTIEFPFVTDAAGDFYSPFVTSKFIPQAVGATVDTQAAFVDGNNKFQMTRAASATIEALPPGSPIVFASRLYSYGAGSLGATAGFGPFETRVPVVFLK